MLDRAGFRDFAAQVRDTSEMEAIRAWVKASKLSTQDKNHLYTTQESRVGESLGLPIWNEAFPDYPFRLTVLPKSRMKKVTRLDILFKKRGRKVLIEEFETRVQEAIEQKEQRCTVMMLKLPYLDEWCVMHNAPSNEVHGVRLTFALEESGRQAYLEPLSSFLVFFVGVTGNQE